MEPNRTGNQLIRSPRGSRQRGITVIGFLLLAVVFGVVGLAVLKIVPLYMEKMRVGTVLSDLQSELATGGNTAQGIRIALEQRMYVENLRPLTANELNITREGEGYTVHVSRESREPFLADLFFVVVIDEQVEISR
jgi:Tfp pilus assembly major pilin PilA